MTPYEKRRLAAERAHQVALRAEKRTVPVVIEIMSQAGMFAHQNGLVLYRMTKLVTDDDCSTCERPFQPAESSSFAFARRRPIWDADLWVMRICPECFSKSDLVERVRACAIGGMGADHVVVSCQLIGPANDAEQEINMNDEQ
jgi:hypothetical protein